METREQKHNRLITFNRWKNESKSSFTAFKLQLELLGLSLNEVEILSPAESYELLYRLVAPRSTNTPTALRSSMLAEGDFENACQQLLETLGDIQLFLSFANYEHVGVLTVSFAWVSANILGLLKLDGDSIFVWDHKDLDSSIVFDFVSPDNFDPGFQIILRGLVFKEKVAESNYLTNLLSIGNKDGNGLPWMTPEEAAQENLELARLANQREMLVNKFKADLTLLTGLVCTSAVISKKASFGSILYRKRILRFYSPPKLCSPLLEANAFTTVCTKLGGLVDSPVQLWFKNHTYAGVLEVDAQWLTQNVKALLKFDGEQIFLGANSGWTEIVSFSVIQAESNKTEYQIEITGEKLLEKFRGHNPKEFNRQSKESFFL